jgi:hypothetical protein
MRLYVLDGKVPIHESNVLRWSKWFSKANRIVKQDVIEDGNIGISTVFLGLDHRFFGDGPGTLQQDDDHAKLYSIGSVSDHHCLSAPDNAERVLA